MTDKVVKVVTVETWELNKDSLTKDGQWIKSAHIVRDSQNMVYLSVSTQHAYHSDTYQSIFAAKQSFGKHFQPKAQWIKTSIQNGEKS